MHLLSKDSEELMKSDNALTIKLLQQPVEMLQHCTKQSMLAGVVLVLNRTVVTYFSTGTESKDRNRTLSRLRFHLRASHRFNIFQLIRDGSS